MEPYTVHVLTATEHGGYGTRTNLYVIDTLLATNVKLAGRVRAFLSIADGKGCCR